MKTRKISSKEKKEIWNMFDSSNADDDDSKKIECVYSKDSFDGRCISCNGVYYINEQGFYECINKKCGIIYKDVLDLGAEWRYYGADDTQSSDPTRCGMPINPLLKESSHGCKIMCSRNSSYEMRKIHRYTEWQSSTYKEKTKYDDFCIISDLASKAGIPKIIIDDAIRYYNKISEARSFRGLNREGILAASIYISCSINNTPRTPKEIAVIFRLDNTSTTKGCKNSLYILHDLEKEDTVKTHLFSSLPSSFIERYCSQLNINKEFTKLGMFISKIVEKNNLIPENTPHAVATGIIFYISQNCNINITKRDIHNISDVSEVTINKCFKKLEEQPKKLIPQKFLK